MAPDDRAAPGISGEGHQLWKESLGEEDRIAPPALPREGMNEIGRFQKGIYQVFNTFCCQIWLIADRKQDSVHIPQGGEAQPDTRRHPLPGVAIEEGKVAQLSRLGQYLAILAGDHRLCKEGGGQGGKGPAIEGNSVQKGQQLVGAEAAAVAGAEEDATDLHGPALTARNRWAPERHSGPGAPAAPGRPPPPPRPPGGRCPPARGAPFPHKGCNPHSDIGSQR